jgi:hypothetical protein
MSDEQSMLNRWAPWYSTGQRCKESYGPATSYTIASDWLAGLAVEDWGCGYAQFREYHKGPYTGIDGTEGWADHICDLRTHTSSTEGLLMRHVLEHNPDWRSVLKNAIASFTQRMVLVVFTPDSEGPEKTLAFVASVGVHDLSLPFVEIEASFADCRILDRIHVATATGYQGETLWLVER